MTSFFPELSVEPVIEFCKGDVLKDRYQILKKYTGKNGIICYCVDLWDETPCVLKTHPSQLAKDAPQKLVDAFRQELARMTQIPPHRYVVPFYRVEYIQDIYFLVTEWLPYSLRDRLELCRRGEIPSLSGREVLTILISICEGMLHCIKWLSTPEIPFVHGDLKPENILVAKDGTVKLMDFGGGWTEEYAPEEQRAGGGVSTRSDIYSVGKILEELLPYCAEQKPFLNQCRQLAQACCRTRPEDRIASFQQLLLKLKQIYNSFTGDDPAPPENSRGEDARFQISRLSNMALIGESVNVYASLTKLLRTPGADDAALAEGFYQAAEIFRSRGMYAEALPLFNIACNCDHDTHSMIWAGKAYTYWCLSDWDNAYTCATHALTISHFDYLAIKIAIDAMYCTGHVQELELVLSALESIQDARSDDPQALKYIGYIHYLRHEYGMACQYFGKYTELRKSDWEMMFFYGLSLYIERDTTRAKQTLQNVIQLVETTADGHFNRRQLSSLAISNYCLGIYDETVRYLELFENQYEINEQISVTEVMLYDDFQLLERHYAALSQIGNEILQAAGQCPPSFFSQAAEQIEQLREQWLRETKNVSLSSAVRRLELMSCSYQQAAYIEMGEYEQALIMCDRALEWDQSSPEAWFNKAEMLVQADDYFQAVGCYQKAEESQTDPKRLDDIRRRLAETMRWLQIDQASMSRMCGQLWEYAKNWNGKPNWLQTNIAGKEGLFGDAFCQCFVMFVKSEIDEAYWISAPRLSAVIQQCFSCAGVMQQIQGPVKEVFMEAAIQVYDVLIDYAASAGGMFARALPLSYSFRGLAYLYRIRGDREQNMDQAEADFQRFLSEAARLNLNTPDMLAEAYDNLGNVCLRREQGNRQELLANAAEYYRKALDIVSEKDDPTEWAIIHYNFGICEFKRHNYESAMNHFQNCLRYFTLQNRPDMFANANEYVCDIGSLILPVSTHFLEVFDENFRVCQTLLSYYTTSRSPEKYANVLLKMVLLMMKRYDRMEDGSWVLMRQYYQEINEAHLNTPEAYELYMDLGKKLEKIVSLRL